MIPPDIMSTTYCVFSFNFLRLYFVAPKHVEFLLLTMILTVETARVNLTWHNNCAGLWSVVTVMVCSSLFLTCRLTVSSSNVSFVQWILISLIDNIKDCFCDKSPKRRHLSGTMVITNYPVIRDHSSWNLLFDGYDRTLLAGVGKLGLRTSTIPPLSYVT